MQLISSANRWVVCAFLAISATPVVAKDCRDLLNAPAEQAQLIACTQAALKAVGYDPGKVDGVLNQRTQALISLFQDSERITQDGKPTVALLSRLLKTAPVPVQIPDSLAGKPVISQSNDPMVAIRRDQYLIELADAIKNEKWNDAIPYIANLDALGIELPESYYYFKGKSLLETGNATGAEENIKRYLLQAGSGGQFYKEALRALSVAEERNKGIQRENAERRLTALVNSLRENKYTQTEFVAAIEKIVNDKLATAENLLKIPGIWNMLQNERTNKLIYGMVGNDAYNKTIEMLNNMKTKYEADIRSAEAKLADWRGEKDSINFDRLQRECYNRCNRRWGNNYDRLYQCTYDCDENLHNKIDGLVRKIERWSRPKPPDALGDFLSQ